MVELVAAVEEVGERRERGRHEQHRGDDEEALAHAEVRMRSGREPFERESERRRAEAGDDERPDRIAVPECKGDGEHGHETEVLHERPDEVRDRHDVDRQPSRAADPRDGLRQLRAPRRPTARSAASVKMITRSPASRTSSPCGKIAPPLRTIAPMIEPCTGMSRKAMPM